MRQTLKYLFYVVLVIFASCQHSNVKLQDTCSVFDAPQALDGEIIKIQGYVRTGFPALYNLNCPGKIIVTFLVDEKQAVGAKEFDLLIFSNLGAYDRAVSATFTGEVVWPSGGIQERGFLVREITDAVVIEVPRV